MDKDPKIFYDYIKEQNKRDNAVGPFKKNKKYIYDAREICQALADQYNSEFSPVIDGQEPESDPFGDVGDGDMIDVELNEINITEAIGELNASSTAGSDGVPAILLIKTKDTIALPLKLILRKSIDEGKIHNIHKMAYVTPIHKGGSKLNPERYRPVSLTSHIMKVFERVVKSKIMDHLMHNGLINPGQHGFVPGRSTQTQLMRHYMDVYDALAEGNRIDTVYLDFAKAFDKVDHKILLQKVARHGIKGKIGGWIREFLRDRKYRVIANGAMSEIQDVTSGVPQGTVLAAILFIIMMSDIDEEVRESIVGSYADDTKVSKAIRSAEDKTGLQRDLNSI